MLSIVATPIGNLGDLTYRAVEVLKNCDLILCEDTRRSRILLNHYSIDRPLKSYHKFSEAKLESFVIEKLQSGAHMALISDAGTPLISDPGERLVRRCIEEEIEIEALPGATAAMAALVLSGLSASRFQFVGFLPKKGEKLLKDILKYPGSTICYVSPYQIFKVLEKIQKFDPDREVVVARELTKKFEEIVRGRVDEIVGKLKNKGEFVLILAENKNFIEN